MSYWIDGYNVILHRRGGGEEPLATARERLVRDLAALGVAVRVYFDASGTGGGVDRAETARGGIRVVYVARGSADDAMVAALRRGGEVARDVTLVTNDRELRRRARQLGASTVSVDKFVARLERAVTPVRPSARSRDDSPSSRRPPNAPLSDREIDDWMQWFGFDGDSEDSPDPS